MKLGVKDMKIKNIKSKKKALINLIIIGIILFCLLIINLFMYFKNVFSLYDDKNRSMGSLNISYPYFNNDCDVYIEEYLNSLDESKASNVKYLVNYLGDYLNIMFKLYNKDKIFDYHSMLFNKSCELIALDSLILKPEILEQKINLYIDAYKPKITKEDYNKAAKSYLFKDFEVEIYLTNYNEQGNISFININYHELKEYLNFPYKLSKNYIFLKENPPKTTTTKKSTYKNTDKLVAFTFDDGPSTYTLDLLDVLAEYKAKATFFLVGYNIKHRNSVVLETFNRGHEIGNHTTDHSNLAKLKEAKVLQKIDANSALYYNITEQHMNLLRPPYGSVNKKMLEYLKQPVILWSVDSRDWESRNTEKIVEVVLSDIKEGDIVLFHDLYGTTIEAVKALLPILYADGYRVVTVSELFAANDKPLENGIIYRNAR